MSMFSIYVPILAKVAYYTGLTMDYIFLYEILACVCTLMVVGNLSLKLHCKPEYFETWHTVFGVGAVHLAKSGSVSCSLFIVQVPRVEGST